MVMGRFCSLTCRLALTGWAVIGLLSGPLEALEEERPLTVYLAPNTHGTVSGWLVDFDSERSHVVNNYLSHMDRVASDPNYAMAFSEVPNLMVLMQFAPQRLSQLKQQSREGRLELVNGFFLEPTINLSGGEALVQMGVLGLRWYDEVFGRRPRFSWMIDVCGAHRQMPQIVSGLGLEALFFSRNNPAPKSSFWWISPDGSRTLAICLGQGYSSTSKIFSTESPLTETQMDDMFKFFQGDRRMSSSSDSVFVAVGGGDYSLAPRRPGYPTELQKAWQKRYPQVALRFAVPSEYVDALQKEIREGETTLPEYRGDTAYSYNAFWMNMPEIKHRYRVAEHTLQASELLATAASLTRGVAYPSEPLYHSWILMLMNMDRNVLWGAGAGAPFYDSQHWNVQDRFDFVEKQAETILETSLRSQTVAGPGLAIFNPLNWRRNDPIEIVAPAKTILADSVCESRVQPDHLLCTLSQPSAGISSFKLQRGQAPAPSKADFEETVETTYHILKIDRANGSIISLREKPSGREYLGGPANVILAESVAGIVDDPANWMTPRPQRKMIDSSSHHPSQCQLLRGPLTTTIVAHSGFVGGSSLERRVILYKNFPRVDFETTVDLHSPDLLVTVDFPLSGAVTDRTRGIPYGFSSVDPRHVSPPLDYFLMGDHKLYGFSSALAPAVRWSDYGFTNGGGIALLDRGLASHELNGNTVTLTLLNAQSTYRHLPNTILAGQGRRTFSYAIWPHEGSWQQARIPQRAWEYNTPVFSQAQRVISQELSLLKTSPNVIVEAVRRVGKDIEIRFVEWTGTAGQAEITLNLPHQNARRTNLMGEHEQLLEGSGGTYHFKVEAQQIVTLRFATSSSVTVPPAIRTWDALVPQQKRKALHEHSDLKGYPGTPPASREPSKSSQQ